MSDQRTVLCVLSDEQRSEYRDELAGLEHRGLSLVHMDDPDEALDRAATLEPQLVIAGMELGPMEGLEFLAFFMKRYPQFERTVVVLPRKDDPFPPMAHSRDPMTGRSNADEVSIDRLDDLIPAAAPAAAEAPVLRASAVPAETRPAWLIPAIAVGAVVILGIAGVVLFAGSDDSSEPAVTKAEPAEPAPPKKTEAPKDEPAAKTETPEDQPAAKTATPKDEPAAKTETPEDQPAAKTEEPAAPKEPTVDVSQPVALPFTFEKASGRPVLGDGAKLRALIKALGPSGRVELGGHTSNEGDPGYNRKLGRIRAEAVKALLVKRGVPRNRIVVKSHGGDAPVASNDTEEGRRQNRRVTVRVRP